ncbi:MAG: hypothetical protein HOP15_15415 [Planctomycetes bacterium]|nr:hypothetical protein [Planctomycetota bacterium]
MNALQALLLTTSSLALAGLADAQSVGTSYSRSFGSSLAGGSFHADAGLSLASESYEQDQILHHAYDLDGDANLYAGVSLFSRTLEAFRFQARASLSDDTGSLNGTSGALSGLVRVGGYTVYSALAEEELAASRSFGPYNIFPGDLSATWWLGPVPVTIRANAGSGAALSVQLNANPIEHQVRVTGTPRAWQYGWASVGLNWGVFSTGLQANLTLANSTLSLPLIADLEDGFSGALALSMNPIAIYLRLFATVNLWFWQQSWYLTLYSWSARSIGTTLSLL